MNVGRLVLVSCAVGAVACSESGEGMSMEVDAGPPDAGGGPIEFGTVPRLAWVRVFGGASRGEAEPSDVDTDESGNVLVGGEYTAVSGLAVDFGGGPLPVFNDRPPERDAFIVNLTPGGDFRWATGFGGVDSDGLGGIDVGASGTVVTAGHFRVELPFGARVLSAFTDQAGYFGMISSAGAQLDAWLIGAEELNAQVFAAADGGFVLVMGAQGDLSYSGEVIRGSGFREIYIVSIRSDGTHQWSGSIGGAGSDDLGGAVIDDDAIYLSIRLPEGGTARGTMLEPSSAGVQILALGRDGAYRWHRTYMGADPGHLAVGGGSLYMTGRLGPSDAFGVPANPACMPPFCKDSYVARFDAANGDQTWARRIQYTGPGSSAAVSSIALDASGAVYLGGIAGDSFGDEPATIDFGGGVLDAGTGSESAFLAAWDASGTPLFGRLFRADDVVPFPEIHVHGRRLYYAVAAGVTVAFESVPVSVNDPPACPPGACPAQDFFLAAFDL